MTLGVLADQMKKLAAIKKKHEKLIESINYINKDISKHKKVLKNTHNKIDELSTCSVTSLISTITFKRQKELQNTNNTLQRLKDTIGRLECEIKGIEKEIDLLAFNKQEYYTLSDQYTNMYNRVEAQLEVNIDKEAMKYQALQRSLIELVDSISDINKVINIGEKIETLCVQADRQLASAKKLGTLDILGGGLVTGLAKKSKVDKASTNLNDVSYYIDEYCQAISKVDASIARIQAEALKKSVIIDIVFDNLITDMMSQNNIKHLQGDLQSLLHEIDAMAKNLKGTRRTLQATQDTVKQALDDIIINYDLKENLFSL